MRDSIVSDVLQSITHLSNGQTFASATDANEQPPSPSDELTQLRERAQRWHRIWRELDACYQAVRGNRDWEEAWWLRQAGAAARKFDAALDALKAGREVTA